MGWEGDKYKYGWRERTRMLSARTLLISRAPTPECGRPRSPGPLGFPLVSVCLALFH